MTTRSNTIAAASKENIRAQIPEMKTPVATSPVAVKPNALPGKGNKITNKEMPTSPTPQVQPAPSDELLGSLTTEQQQRTSARVIKKLLLDDAAHDRDKKDLAECDVKIDDKDKHIVKQRMPKALWSSDEKDLFFEALNEFGKDFDALTSHICAKMKKKGVSDANLKNKHQVSHFYYRTWHKLSKYVHFDDNVKKVAQELYSLINYGELRKKCSSVSDKVCARLGEMVAKGGIVVRLKGKNLRVRTPMCRALRRLNQITERSYGPRTCTRTTVYLHARDESAWTRVQSAAHNPRHPYLEIQCGVNMPEKEARYENGGEDAEERDYGDELHVEVDRIVKNKKFTLHVGPRPNAEIHLPTISPCEQLSSQKICFSSYLERMGSNKEGCPQKIRTPKRQRKDSATDKDKDEPKKIKTDEQEHKMMDIEETAIDGIELMATINENKIVEDDKPNVEIDDILDDDREERDKERESERENYSFSEMEDDEKYNKSDTDNEADRCHKSHKDTKFKNLKVKFRIRPKKQGGSIYTLVTDTSKELADEDANKVAEECTKIGDELKSTEFQPKADGIDDKPDLDVEMVLKQIRTGWSVSDAGQLTIGDLYLMFGSRSRLELDYWWAEPSPPIAVTNKKLQLPQEHAEKPLKVEKPSPEKESEDIDKLRESDTEMFSPKNVFQDSNDGLSGDERKIDLLVSPDHKGQSLRIADKLVNKARDTTTNHRFVATDRLRRLVSLASSINARCSCAQSCHIHRRKPTNDKHQLSKGDPQLFRHPTPIAPKPDESTDILQAEREKAPQAGIATAAGDIVLITRCYLQSALMDLPLLSIRQVEVNAVSMSDVPRWKRGRPRNGTKSSVVVQRLLPLLPKPTAPSHDLIPVKLVSNCPTIQPKLAPKPPVTAADGSYIYISGNGCNNLYLIEDEDNQHGKGNEVSDATDPLADATLASTSANHLPSTTSDDKEDVRDNMSALLSSESLSLSPSQLLRVPSASEREVWFCGEQDFSLSSFLAQLEHKSSEMSVDSQFQSLLTESSIDYVAKFADLAAQVTADNDKCEFEEKKE